MKTVVIHQPDFMPYLGFFHRLLHADLYIVLDDVQFLRRGWHHRDKIKTPHGDKWFTLGLQKSPQNEKINNIMLNHEDWKQEHLNLFIQNYKKAPYYAEIFPYIELLYSNKFDKMIDFNMISITMLMKLFNISIEMEYSSKYNLQTKANELLSDLLQKVEATNYLSGIGAKDYFDSKPFNDANIEVIWQDFKHPIYPQLHGEFIPYLSSIDLLFNCGIDKSREILRNI